MSPPFLFLALLQFVGKWGVKSQWGVTREEDVDNFSRAAFIDLC